MCPTPCAKIAKFLFVARSEIRKQCHKRHAGVASANSCEPSRSAMFSVITFRVSRRRREMYSGHARLCVCVRGRMRM